MSHAVRISIGGLALLMVSCSTTSKSDISELDVILNGPLKGFSDSTHKEIQHVIRTDLQFQRGCRERGIDVENCDFQNSLDVSFLEFNCKPDTDNPKTVASRRLYDPVCDYTANLTRPDGQAETIAIKSERYEYGIVYMDELIVEHGWEKVPQY